MPPHDDSGPDVGFTGARFGGGGRRRGRPAPSPVLDDATAALPAVTAGPAPAVPGEPVVGFTGARFGGPSRRRRRAVLEPPAAESPVPEPTVVGPGPPPPTAAREPVGWREPARDPDPISTSFVRPYVLTSGRTHPAVDLAIEALVSVVPAAVGELTPHPDIVELCREPRSVAEVAALRGVPLGVARVLLGDLAAAGAIVVHRTVDAGGPDLALMERVLSGLRRL